MSGNCNQSDGLAGGISEPARWSYTNDFHWTTQGISHKIRRTMILKEHPEIEEMYGHDVKAGIYAITVTLLNIWIMWKVAQWDLNWLYTFLITFFVSGSLNHVLFLSMHEASHCALFPSRKAHEWYVVFCNLSMGIPAGMGFIRYHLDHHAWMGVDGLDPDIPSVLEGMLFSSILGKIIFVMLLPFTYSIRPMLRNPKSPVFMEFVNWVVVLLWDILVMQYLGSKALFYIIAGTLLSMSIHPLNGHLIAEHYQFPSGEALQETWSTYGWENYITFFVGYHIEHHDFPQVPGYRLPMLHMKAKEFYDLPHHKNWLRVMYDFIFNENVNPFSRVKRVRANGGSIQRPHQPFVDEETLGSYWNGPRNNKQRIVCEKKYT